MSQKRTSKNGVMSIAERLLLERKEANGSSYVASDDEVATMVPSVHDLLTRRLKDDKKVIEPGSLLVFARSGGWHACLSHKGLDLKWWGEGPTIKAALVDLERACNRENGQEGSPVNRLNTEP